MSSPTSGNLCPIKQEVSSSLLWNQDWLFQKCSLIILFFVHCLAYWLIWFCSRGGREEILVEMGNNISKSNSCVHHMELYILGTTFISLSWYVLRQPFISTTSLSQEKFSRHWTVRRFAIALLFWPNRLVTTEVTHSQDPQHFTWLSKPLLLKIKA